MLRNQYPSGAQVLGMMAHFTNSRSPLLVSCHSPIRQLSWTYLESIPVVIRNLQISRGRQGLIFIGYRFCVWFHLGCHLDLVSQMLMYWSPNRCLGRQVGLEGR